LDISELVDLVQQHNIDAVHPAYGFLSESTDFAAAMADVDVMVVGPGAENLKRTGDKLEARLLAVDCKVPVLPALTEPTGRVDAVRIFAEKTGFPVMVKAIDGGGGRGIRLVRDSDELESLVTRAIEESPSKQVFAEKAAVDGYRHVEVQIVGDGRGGVMHLWERECSIQRRYQKIVELAPSTVVTREVVVPQGVTCLRLATGPMDGISLLDFLESDPRPTVVFDSEAVSGSVAGSICLQNRAFRERTSLLEDTLHVPCADASSGEVVLETWIADKTARGASPVSPTLPCKTSIYGFTIAGRWKVVQWQLGGHGTSVHTELSTSNFSDGREPSVGESAAPTRSRLNKSDSQPEGEALEDILEDRNIASAKLASMISMMEMVDVGFYEYDMTGRLVQGNNAFYKLSGHPKVDDRSELSELSFSDQVFPEDRDLVHSQWIALTEGRPVTFEMRWKRPAHSRPNGEEDLEGQWVLAACVPTRNKKGEIFSITGCITDISDQKRHQKQLERAYASERRFGRFCEFANVAIVICDTTLQVTYIVCFTGGFQAKDTDISHAFGSPAWPLTNAFRRYCNREWFAIIGHPVVEFKDIDWASYVPPEDLEFITQQSLAVVHTKRPNRYQFRLRRPWSNGAGGTGQSWMMACCYPELNEDGSVQAVAATIVDISYLKWAEDVQRRRTDEALEAKRQQENFIDFTCHEVRNPLGAVMHSAEIIDTTLAGFSSLVESIAPHLSGKQRNELETCHDSINESVNTIMSCAIHQKRIMDDILTLSKLDSKLLTISPAPIELDSILKDVQKMFEKDAQKMGVDLHIVKDSSNIDNVDWVLLDAGRLMQVLINLITNALKFTQTEAVRMVTITMHTSRRRFTERDLAVEFIPVNMLRDRKGSVDFPKDNGTEIFMSFTVRDTGCGFSEEQKTTIFERFAQASPRTHTKYGGSGLGLFITRELVEMQGGEVGVSSRPGDGAMFAFYIAARAIEAPQPENDASTPALPKRTLSMGGSYSILVVEDNVVNQKVLRKQLEKLGHKVYIASHGGEALSFLATTACWTGKETSPTSDTPNVSIILMDVEMPVMDGLTCARKIREAQSQGALIRRLPIIAVSANARYEQVSQAIESGMDDAITKPFRIAELVPKMDRLVAATDAEGPVT
ncbi:Hybrid signal transduction histidine kinase K, partial [Teratosphaeria destructans]